MRPPPQPRNWPSPLRLQRPDGRAGGRVTTLTNRNSMSIVTDRFEYKRPSPAGVSRIETIRAACRDLADIIEKTCPSCRETSFALTKLEEVSFWANKGIAFNDSAPSDNG